MQYRTALICLRIVAASIMHRKKRDFVLIMVVMGFVITVRYIASFEKMSAVSKTELLLPISEYSGVNYCGDFPCIGDSACMKAVKISNINEFIKDGEWTIFNGIIHEGQFRNPKPAVIHILGDAEQPEANFTNSLNAWKATLCRIVGEGANCNHSLIQNIPVLRQVSTIKGYLKSTMVRKLSTNLECASQRLVNRIVRRCGSLRHGYRSLRKLSKKLRKSLVFKLMMAPRLWMRETFPSDERWPFGNSIGACGRIVVNRGEYGVPLDELYEENWESRLDLSAQILEIVSFLSDNEYEYFFEVQDITSSYFVRYSTGKLRLDIYDGIRIKDRRKNKRKRGMSRSCVTFNEAANFRAACRILAGYDGLLHDAEGTYADVSELQRLLNQCLLYNATMPSDRNGFDDLLSLLYKLRSCTQAFEYRYPECQYMQV